MKINEGKLCSVELCLKAAVLGKYTRVLEEIQKITEELMRCLGQSNCSIIIADKEELLPLIETFDMVIMDVTIAEPDSLDAVQTIHNLNPEVKLIIIAEDDTYIKWAFKARAYRYLNKGQIEREMREALEDAVKETGKTQGILVEMDGSVQQILYKDMIYFESVGDMVVLYFNDSHVTLKKPLNYLITLLNSDFYQCHKSYIINMKWISAFGENDIILKNEITIMVSVRRKSGLMRAYHDYAIRNGR